MATPQQYQPEDTMNLIQERAKVSGDRFRIHVFRRNPQTGVSAQVAGLDAATIDHIADHSRWLPMLLGGGEYTMQVFHSSDQSSQRIGGALPAVYDSKPGSSYGPPKAGADINAMRSDSWTGPAILTTPPPATPEPTPILGATPKGVVFVAGNGLPPAGATAQAQNPPQPYVDWFAQQQADITKREREVNEALARQQKEMATKEAELRRIESETRLRSEMAQQTNDLKNTLAAMASRLDTPRAPDTGMKDVLGALAPLAAQFIQSNNDFRLQMLKMEQENARMAREAESRRAETDAKRHEESLRVQLEMIKAQAVKPGMSDEMKLLIETLKAEKSNSSVDAMAAMMTRMVDAVGVVSKMSINMIETIAEQMGGDAEDPMVVALREGTKAMMMLTQGGQSAATRIVPGANKPKPQAPAQPQPQPAQPQRAAPVAQPQRPPQSAAPGAQPPPRPPAPVPVVTFAPQVPAPAQPETSVPDVRSKMDLLEAAIRGTQPAEDVARVLVTMIAQKEPSLTEELKKNNNVPNEVLWARLGEKWVAEHLPYLKELGTHVDRIGIQAGIFEPDDAPEEVAQEPLPEAEVVEEGVQS